METIIKHNSDIIIKRYNRTSRFYDKIWDAMESSKTLKWRKLICGQAHGKVLEVGVGTGKNIPYYPTDTDLTAIDFSPGMLGKAKKKAARLERNVELLLMDVQDLSFPDETFDTIISTFVFCSVPDPVKGMSEIRRVCKKDGQIIMLEHVRSRHPFIGVLMDIANPFVVRIAGANINRNTVENLKKAGIKVVYDENLMMDVVKYLKCNINGP